MKEGIIIVTVKYRYAKIGPCCTKCHRPSLVWKISNSSRPTIERSSEHNFTRLAEIKSNWISSRALYKWQGIHHYSSPRSVYIRVFHLRNRQSLLQPLLLVCHAYELFAEMFQQDKARPHTARVTMDFHFRTTLLYCHDPQCRQI